MKKRYDFFALLSRMKYINRWGLMRSTVSENIAEHSYHVAVIAHSLAVIKNTYFAGKVNEDRAASIALFHDCSEIITGDMPTPIKYYNEDMMAAYKEIETRANKRFVSMLPKEMGVHYAPLFLPQDEEEALWQIVKAADKISAHIKCLEEVGMSNPEFSKALVSTRKIIDDIKLPEVAYFMEHFLESYGLSLDELK